MNKLFFTVLLFSLGTFAQTKKIDSLINILNNDELHGVCNYVWVLKMDSEAADSLVAIGKPVSRKLYDILDSPEKGIISHCVLSRIWVKDYKISSSFEKFDSEGIVEYNYNGLYFYEIDEKMNTDEKTLSENKEKWSKILNE